MTEQIIETLRSLSLSNKTSRIVCTIGLALLVTMLSSFASASPESVLLHCTGSLSSRTTILEKKVPIMQEPVRANSINIRVALNGAWVEGWGTKLKSISTSKGTDTKWKFSGFTDIDKENFVEFVFFPQTLRMKFDITTETPAPQTKPNNEKARVVGNTTHMHMSGNCFPITNPFVKE